jgi:hypothetical protein
LQGLGGRFDVFLALGGISILLLSLNSVVTLPFWPARRSDIVRRWLFSLLSFVISRISSLFVFLLLLSTLLDALVGFVSKVGGVTNSGR